MKIVKIAPGYNSTILEIDGTLTEMQAIVGGYIEPFPLFATDFEKPIMIVGNEEAKPMGLDFNLHLQGNDWHGTIFFCSEDYNEQGEMELVGLTDDDATFIKEALDAIRELERTI